MSFQLPVTETACHSGRVRAWLFLGCASLIVPGITAILLVILRSTVVSDQTAWSDIFRTALVIHVDLSAFIWFMAFAGLFWVLLLKDRAVVLQRVAFFLCALGTGVIAASPLLGSPAPVMNNYIPVLDQPVFLTGLGMVGVGLVLISALMLSTGGGFSHPSERSMALAGRLGALVTLLAVVTLVISWFDLEFGDNAYAYYEALFWGSGHVLQYVYTILLFLAWLWIVSEIDRSAVISVRLTNSAFLINVAPLLAVPWILVSHEIGSLEYRQGFVALMKYGHGAAVVLIAMALISSLFRGAKSVVHKPLFAAMVTSILLFVCGGLVGFVISGVNTIIPAHYHGSIVGITLALMGFSYALLPRLGYAEVSGPMAVSQPWIYAVGQLMHISGLIISGMHGAQRKTVGVAENPEFLSETIGVWLIRIGGLLAVLGGLLFLLVVWRSVRAARRGIVGLNSKNP